MTVNKLFDTFGKGYFWTFTFKKVMPDWWYPRHWNMFCTSLGNLYGGWVCGVRVLEVHPGGHGLHYHAIIAQRLNVHLVRRCGARVGIGRVHVERCNRATALYLAKYLTKKSPLHSGMKRWATMGGFVGVKKSKVEINSTMHRNIAVLTKGRQVGFDYVNAIRIRSELFGAIEVWPAGMRSEVELTRGKCPIERVPYIIEKVRR